MSSDRLEAHAGLAEREHGHVRASPRHDAHAQILAEIDQLRGNVRLGVATAVEEGASVEGLDRALADAEQFVQAWPRTAVARPDVGLANDGEVSFFWRHKGAQVDLGFFGDGTYSYFAKDRHGERSFGDDVPAGEGLADELSLILVDRA